MVPPEDTIRYYESVVRSMGAERASATARLFLVPGMGHCSGGPGPSTFDGLSALDAWVTHGTAPAKILATHSTNGKVDRSRPLCPYPQIARWKGPGSTDDAEAFDAWLRAVAAVPASLWMWTSGTCMPSLPSHGTAASRERPSPCTSVIFDKLMSESNYETTMDTRRAHG